MALSLGLAEEFVSKIIKTIIIIIIIIIIIRWRHSIRGQNASHTSPGGILLSLSVGLQSIDSDVQKMLPIRVRNVAFLAQFLDFQMLYGGLKVVT